MFNMKMRTLGENDFEESDVEILKDCQKKGIYV